MKQKIITYERIITKKENVIEYEFPLYLSDFHLDECLKIDCVDNELIFTRLSNLHKHPLNIKQWKCSVFNVDSGEYGFTQTLKNYSRLIDKESFYQLLDESILKLKNQF